MKLSYMCKAFCAFFISIMMIGCATVQDETGPVGEAPPPETPFEPGAAAPKISPLRNGSYLTSLQSDNRSVMTDDTVKAQIEGWGRFYTQIRIEDKENIETISPEGDARQSFSTVTCKGRNLSGFGKLLAGLVRLEKNTSYVLSVSVSPSGSTGDKYYVNKYPVLQFSRLNDKRCRYHFRALPLTPRIAPRSNERLKFEFQLHYKKSNGVDVNQIFSDIAEIAGFFTQTPTDGVVAGATELAASSINARINQIMSEWSKDNQSKFEAELPLGIEPALKHDTFVISANRPTNTQSASSISFGEGQSIWFRVDYFPTLFAQCTTPGIDSCFAYESNAEVLGEKYHEADRSVTLGDLANQNNNNTPAYRQQLLAIKNANPPLSDNAAKLQFEKICGDIDSDTQFAPNKALNKVDRLIFLYSLIASTTDYEDNYSVNTDKCFSAAQRELLQDLASNGDERFRFPVFEGTTLSRVIEKSNDLSFRLGSGLTGKEALFGESGRLDLRLGALVEGANGVELRPRGSVGQAAAAALEPIKFEGGPACHHTSVDRNTGKESAKKFGIMHKIRDTLDGGYYEQNKNEDGSGGRLYVPIVVEMDDENGVASMVVPSSWREYYTTLLNRPMPADPWAAACMPDLDQDALDALKAEMSGA